MRLRLIGLIGLIGLMGPIGIERAKAQDIHFSMLDLDPMLFNPGYSGFFDGQGRFGLVYRNQWATVTAPFQTVTATAEWGISRSKRNGSGLSAGLWVSHDRAGTLNYGSSTASFVLSYFRMVVNSSNLVSVALEGGVGQSGFNTENIVLTDATETFVREKALYPTFGAGVAWFRQWSDALYTKVGLSARNLNEPDISYLGLSDTRLSRHYNIYARAEWRCWPRVSLMPVVGYQFQKGFQELVYGCDAKWYAGNPGYDHLAFVAGLLGRHGDAMAVNLALEWRTWVFGFSYDANLSTLAEASHTLGAFEVGIVYKLMKEKRNYQKRALPCPII